MTTKRPARARTMHNVPPSPPAPVAPPPGVDFGAVAQRLAQDFAAQLAALQVQNAVMAAQLDATRAELAALQGDDDAPASAGE